MRLCLLTFAFFLCHLGHAHAPHVPQPCPLGESPSRSLKRPPATLSTALDDPFCQVVVCVLPCRRQAPWKAEGSRGSWDVGLIGALVDGCGDPLHLAPPATRPGRWWGRACRLQ